MPVWPWGQQQRGTRSGCRHHGSGALCSEWTYPCCPIFAALLSNRSPPSNQLPVFKASPQCTFPSSPLILQPLYCSFSHCFSFPASLTYPCVLQRKHHWTGGVCAAWAPAWPTPQACPDGFDHRLLRSRHCHQPESQSVSLANHVLYIGQTPVNWGVGTRGRGFSWKRKRRKP